ncbi:MAG: ABC transporter ATP-binding protein [Fretibacterium sp.]|nr:ABC transporter ATP-binding protein [Fretibacterium sp.]
MLKKFVRYYLPHKKLFLADMFCALVLSLCGMFYPMIARAAINRYIPQRELGPLLFWMGVLLALYSLKAALTFFVQYYGHVMGVRIQVDIRRDAFEHLQRLPFAFFDKTRTGALMSCIINDTFEIAELAHHGPEDLFISLAMLTGSFFLLCSMNVPLTLIIFAFIPILTGFAALKRRKLSRTSMRTRREIAEVNADLQNAVAGVRVSRAFESSDLEIYKFERSNTAYERARGQQYRAMGEFFSGTGYLLDLLLLVTLTAGGIFAYKGAINAGDLAAYLLFVGLFTEPIKRLIQFTEQFQSGMTGFVRIQELLAAEPERDDPDAVELTDIQGAISFQDVSFRYEDGQDILVRLSLDIRPGETVALVGPSGGGKSTLCHLLLRFYEPIEGAITLDGRDIRRITRSSLRRNIGIVQQDTYLFSGTIRDNIAYSSADATDEAVRSAAQQAALDDFILSLPEGYETQVGERGVMLSGGQRQRIAIARVFLKNPRLLILDEATSALDNVTEAQIQSSLEALCRGRTTLMVAHRLSTVRHADRIIVLTQDGVAEQGTHEELAARGGVYARLVNPSHGKTSA